MNGLATKHKVTWIDIYDRHDGLTINFPDGKETRVETKAEAKTIIRHWVREAGYMAQGVKVIWPKMHQEMWAVDL